MSITLLGTHVISTGTALAGISLISAMAISNLRKRYVGITLFSIALLIAYYYSYIDITALSVAAFYGFICHQFSFKNKGALNVAYGVLIFILSAILLLHAVPGFHNPIVIDSVAVSSNAPLYSQYLNFDKAIVGFFLLIYVISTPPKISYHSYLAIIIGCSFSYGVAILLATTSGLVDYDIKFPDYILGWILINLFVTTYAEEAFFRGFVLRPFLRSR